MLLQHVLLPQGWWTQGGRGEGMAMVSQIFPDSIKWDFDQTLSLMKVYQACPRRFCTFPWPCAYYADKVYKKNR